MAIAEAVVTISFSYLFAAQNFSTHAVMILLLSDVIGLTFYTIMTLDFPFTGFRRYQRRSLCQTGDDVGDRAGLPRR